MVVVGVGDGALVVHANVAMAAARHAPWRKQSQAEPSSRRDMLNSAAGAGPNSAVRAVFGGENLRHTDGRKQDGRGNPDNVIRQGPRLRFIRSSAIAPAMLHGIRDCLQETDRDTIHATTHHCGETEW